MSNRISGFSNNPGSSTFLLHKCRPRRECERGPGTQANGNFFYALILLPYADEWGWSVSAGGPERAARPAEPPPAAVASAAGSTPPMPFANWPQGSIKLSEQIDAQCGR